MLTRMQFLATRWALTAAMLMTLLSLGISYEAWAQAIHPAQRAIAAANTEKASEAEIDPAKQSLESLIAPIVRDAVQAELKSAKAAKPAGDPMDQTSSADPFADLIENLRTSVGQIAGNFNRVMVIASNLEGHANRAFLLLTDLEGWPVAWAGLLNLALMLAAGLAAASFAYRRLERFIRPKPCESFHLIPRLSASLAGLARDGLGLAVFVLVAFALSLIWFEQNAPIRILLLGGLGAATTGYVGWIIGRFLLAPHAPERRLAHVLNASALRTSRWLTAVMLLAGFMTFAGGVFNLTTMPRGAFALLLMLGGLTIALLTARLVLRSGGRSDDAEYPTLSRGVRFSLLIGLLLLTLLWTVSLLSGDLSKPVAVLMVFAAIAGAVYLGAIKARRVHVVHHTATDIPVDPEDIAEMGDAADQTAPKPDTLEVEYSSAWLAKVLEYVLFGLAGLALLHVFGVDMIAALNSSIGLKIAEAAGKVATILVVAAVVWTLVEQSIARIMEREEALARANAGDQAIDEDGLGGLVTSRFGTLLPLMRGFVLSVLAIITIMVVLSSMGIDIGPLLAGAGVAGIAIGFGAQALVRDIISGVFFLIDDAFRVGEYVEFGEIRGQVEKISIRSMRLRHHRGAIHTVPFGELRSITNYNRDWAIYKQEFRLPYDTDTEVVRKIIKKVGLALLEHPELGEKFIQPLKSQGVFRIEEGALILRTKFMCKPREQFVIRKAVFQDVKNALYAAGIELAQRRVQIEWNGHGQTEDGGQPAGQPSGQAIAAAGGAGLIASTGKAKSAYPDEP